MESLYKPLEKCSKRFGHQINKIYLIWNKKAKWSVLLISQGVMWQFYHASLLSFTILTNPDHSRFHPLTPDLDLNICGLR